MALEMDSSAAPTAHGGDSRKLLRLYMVKGFFTPGVAMDADLWSGLPEDLLWEVLRFVPAATRCRLRSVSRKWRQVLTSAPADFRNGTQLIAAAVAPAPRCQTGQQEQRVIAHGRGSRVKVVDVDLSSFVPSWFWIWTSNNWRLSYSIVAAAEGLVCIANDVLDECLPHWHYATAAWRREPTRYCVISPLTRTCKELPPVPFRPLQWLPPTTTTLTIVGGWQGGAFEVATYDMAAGGSRNGWNLAAYHPFTWRSAADEQQLLVAECAGKTFLCHCSRLQVLAPRDGGAWVEVDALAEPPCYYGAQYHSSSRKYLAVHGGALFYVRGVRNYTVYELHGVVIQVWRLASKPHERGGSSSERLCWHEVAQLDGGAAGEFARLTGLGRMKKVDNRKSLFRAIKRRGLLCDVRGVCGVREFVYCAIKRRGLLCDVRGVCGVREFVYCNVEVDRIPFMVELNLDTGKWKVVRDSQGLRHLKLVELRPDLFL